MPNTEHEDREDRLADKRHDEITSKTIATAGELLRALAGLEPDVRGRLECLILRVAREPARRVWMSMEIPGTWWAGPPSADLSFVCHIGEHANADGNPYEAPNRAKIEELATSLVRAEKITAAERARAEQAIRRKEVAFEESHDLRAKLAISENARNEFEERCAKVGERRDRAVARCNTLEEEAEAMRCELAALEAKVEAAGSLGSVRVDVDTGRLQEALTDLRAAVDVARRHCDEAERARDAERRLRRAYEVVALGPGLAGQTAYDVAATYARFLRARADDIMAAAMGMEGLPSVVDAANAQCAEDMPATRPAPVYYKCECGRIGEVGDVARAHHTIPFKGPADVCTVCGRGVDDGPCSGPRDG